MKTRFRRAAAADGGYALMLVMGFTGISVVILSGALHWSATSSIQTARNNQYFVTASAAEAATEKILARINNDFQTGGASTVAGNLALYPSQVPTSSEDGIWTDFSFRSNDGTESATSVSNSAPWGYTVLHSQYDGLNAWAATYRITSNARQLNTPYDIAAAVQQDVQTANIPIFQFAIYYTMDLEINPGPAMNVTGRVHGNSHIYLQPQSTLTFQSHVTAVGNIIHNKSPLDPLVRTPGTIVYNGEHDAGVASLNLPIGTNNTPGAVHSILEIPPVSEDPNSLMGKQRYYNKSDLIVLVSDGGVTVKSGAFNNFANTVPPAEYASFLDMGVSFYNKREEKTVQATELCVSCLKLWSATNTSVRTSLGRDVRCVYIADQRTQTAATQSGVRVVNGQILPPLGLTVATPNPIYVKGHFNAPAAHLGTANTSATLPSSLVGDAINILSGSWSDANSALGLGSRTAANTTVNAAFLGGIVPSNGSFYSGGVENFPRFLENWSGKTFTYNGSMVVMFYSAIANAPWKGTGSTVGVYNAPNRNWAFDLNFLDPMKLPPGTPELRKTIRGQWSLVRAH